MDKKQLKKRIDVAVGRIPADVVIRNAKVVDVCGGKILEGDIAVCDGIIAGVGSYEGKKQYDAAGKYAIPGLIDGHIHIESACVSPEEMGRLIVPFGTTTIVADPHEIVNVCGVNGLNYMLDAAEKTSLDIKYMLPSCVPATPFEHAGAVIDAGAMESPISDGRILGLGEFMNFPGVVNAFPQDLEKILVARHNGKIIDGHCPGLSGKELNAYASTGIHSDHECTTVEEMESRLSAGMYVIMRQGSACHNLEQLLKGVNPYNSRRCLLCSDDRQPKTIFEEGHLDNHLRLCVKNGIDPVTAVQMASLNAAECFGLSDRGAIVPGRRADVVLVDDLESFHVRQVFIGGQEAARDGVYLLPVERQDITPVRGSFHVKDFSPEKLHMHLTSGHVHVIDVMPGGVVTGKGIADISIDENGEFVYSPKEDIVKLAVVERHNNTGNVACGFLRGYGLKKGAVAVSIAHDSHNIIVAGTSDEEMAAAVRQVIEQEGGAALIWEGKTIENMPLPIAGIMSDKSGEWVDKKLTDIHLAAFEKMGISRDVDPVMTLAFMALPVIPELKLTDMGLFDVTRFEFISVEA